MFVWFSAFVSTMNRGFATNLFFRILSRWEPLVYNKNIEQRPYFVLKKSSYNVIFPVFFFFYRTCRIVKLIEVRFKEL